MKLKKNIRKYKNEKIKEDKNQILTNQKYKKLRDEILEEFYTNDLPHNFTLEDLCTKPDFSHLPEGQRPKYIATDYSFREQPDIGQRDQEQLDRELAEYERMKKGKSFRMIAKVAAILLLFLGSATSMGLWMNSQTAMALKFDTDKTLYKVGDGLLSTEKPTEIVGTDASGKETEVQGEGSIEKKYTSMDQIDLAIKFLPELYVPTYIPKGYELESLNIQKSIGNAFSAVYVFKNDKGVNILIHISNRDRDKYVVDIRENQEASEELDISIWEDEVNGESGFGVIKKESVITVSGIVSDEELENIAGGFVKGEDFKQ